MDQSSFYNFFTSGRVKKSLVKLQNKALLTIHYEPAELCILKGVFFHAIPVQDIALLLK